MVTISSIDPTTFIPNKGYSMKEEDSLPSVLVTPNFNPPNGRVESMIYDLSGNQYRYDPNANYAASIPGAKEGENYVDAVTIDPEKVLTSIGLEEGSYNVVFNFLNNELQSSYDRPFRIKEISANRKELRLTTGWLEREELQLEVEQFFPENIETDYYPDFALNFGNGNICIANNLLFDDTNNQYSILVKLYKPLPSFIQIDSGLNPWVVTKQRDSVGYNVRFEPVILPVKTTIDIKGPNFSLDLNNQVHTTVKPTSLDDLESGDSTTEYQLKNILGRKGININIDYSNLDNFIHFSSVEQRVRNFYDKVALLEDLEAELATQNNASDTTNDDVNIKGYQVTKNKIETIIQNFDGFEYWMYYTSESVDSPTPQTPTDTGIKKAKSVTSNAGYVSLAGLIEGGTGDTLTNVGTGTARGRLDSFSFNIPANATINGVEFNYDIKHNSSITAANFTASAKIHGPNETVVFTHTISSSTQSPYTQGGSNDLLGLTGLTATNLSNIGIAFEISDLDASDRAKIRGTVGSPTVKIHYTPEESSYVNKKFPTPYPKTNSTTPYTLASTGSNSATGWLEGFTTTASLYDAENQDNLRNTIPDYIRDDSDNDPYIKFVDLVSQHFDVLFTYAQDITNRYNADNRLDFGISKDLVAEAIKSMGINLYAGNFTANDLAASFTSYNGYTPPQEDGNTVISNYITASVADGDLPPIENVNKEIYKRIYHNLPLLLRQKGSIAGLRTLVNVFGVPNEILNIKEFDINHTFTTQSLPDANSAGQIEFTTQSVPSLPPEGNDSPPSEFLSPTTRVQQHFLTSASTYDSSLQYIEAGFSPQNYLDNGVTPSNDLDSFYDFNTFYFGDNPTNYGNGTGTGDWSTGAYMRYIKFFDTSLFNMIKDFTPARSSVATGFIWKPRINDTRNRYRPAQLSYENITYSGSGVTTFNAWSSFYNREGVQQDSGSITRPIGLIGEKYFAQADGSTVFGTASFPGGTGGTFDASNLPRFNPDGSGGDFNSRKNLQTAVTGLNQKWTEYLNAQSGSEFSIIRNDQSEFYNGDFRQSGLNGLMTPGFGADELKGYFSKELPFEKDSFVPGQGSGQFAYNNNPKNLYKITSADGSAITSLAMDTVSTVEDFDNAASANALIYYRTEGFIQFKLIYVKVSSITGGLDVLLSVGDTLNVTLESGEWSGSDPTLAIPISPGGVPISAGGEDWVVYFPIGFTGFYEQLFGLTDTFTFHPPPSPNSFTEKQNWTYSEFNPLTGNSFDPAAGQDSYAGIRKGTLFQDADYSPSATDPYTPINIALIASGSASKAAVPDSYFRSDWWSNVRYMGSRVSSPDFNQRIIKAVDDISLVFSSESIGIDYNASESAVTPPVEPPQPPSL